ncbi:MAG: asparagine synthase-related protein [Bacteroidales bacterium]|jgi:asparagine synthase (glutamine-hydrolysing)|nr:asparagine synthase-related protein [Bacteroidales bacterium]
MSAIFGIFYRDGKPVTSELETMYGGIKHFPHEKHAFLVHGNCGMGHMLTYNTPEAVNECMPKWLEDEKLLFVAEGRIDNRDELFAPLNVPAEEQKNIPDGNLIFLAYRKWGEDCVDRLMGKWSLAAFHTDSQKLFIARDKWDYTSIDYYINDKVVAFATSNKGLQPLPFIKKELDELMIARLLVIWPGEFDKTYFKNILRLLPSRTLSVSKNDSKLNRYWNYEEIKERKGLKLEDYVEDLFDNFNKAVKCRLRSYKPVAATLSGGMDSSSVCMLAAEHLAGQGKRLAAFSHVPRFSPSRSISNHNFGDESPFIKAIVEASGNIDPHFLTSTEISPIEGVKRGVDLFGEPFHGAGNAYWGVDIYNTVAKRNYGTLLMGEFGNATISWTGLEDAMPASWILKRYGVYKLVKKKVLKPLLYGNNPVTNMYKNMSCGRESWHNYSYCMKSFEDSLGLAEKMKASGFDPTFKRYYVNHNENSSLILDFGVLRLHCGSYAGCELGIELRDPTADPRVIESALSIPNELFIGKMNKWILRSMMKGKLPDIVRLNEKKGKQSSDITARLCAYPEEMNNILREMESGSFGRNVDVVSIINEWKKMQNDVENYPVGKVFHIIRHIAAYIMWENS